MKTKIAICAVMAAVIITLIATLSPIFNVQNDSETLDIFIIDGQSNAAYTNVEGSVNLDVVNPSLGEPSQKLYYYGNTTRPTTYTDSDKNYSMRPIYSNGSYIIGGLVAPFAYYLSQSQHRDILVLDVGISAQSISNLIPGSTGGDWKVKIINEALGSISGYDHINMIGWSWLQGESDTTMAVNTYIDYFNQLEDFYKSINCPNCYIVKTRSAYGGNATIAQSMLILSDPNIHLGTDITETFTGTPLMLDGLHYSQEARIMIAEAVVKVIPIYNFGEWGGGKQVLAAIPVLIIIALIVAVAALIIKKGNEQ